MVGIRRCHADRPQCDINIVTVTVRKMVHGLKASLTDAQLKSAQAYQELARLTSELGWRPAASSMSWND
jgi:hypothetical protein